MGVTAVKLVVKFEVKHADANTENPTELVGKCQLSGLSVSEFLEPQRDAFKATMAASSGAKKDQVLIKGVTDTSAGRRLRGRQLSNKPALLVDFAIRIERAKPAPAKQGLSPGAIAATVVSVIVILALGVGAVLIICRKTSTKNARVGVAADKEKSVGIEMTAGAPRVQGKHSAIVAETRPIQSQCKGV